jgi:DNA-binding protein H-NS
MRSSDLEAMNFEELWHLHEELTRILAEKITAEKNELEKRLAKLNPPEHVQATSDNAPELRKPPRRSYPAVAPKYVNPAAPGERWSGRGKRPRWLVHALQTGHSLEEFKIEHIAKQSDDVEP